MLGTNELLQGRYKINRQLGQGGMGAVYEAEDAKQFGKTVALKEILTALTDVSDSKQHELFRSAFEREAKILMQVDHEAFPQVIDYFSEGNRQFLVMQLIQGRDLNDLLIKRQSAFSLEQVCNWADQLLDALDYLHTLTPPIIHRDIKPQNLKLTNRGKIKLLDFGIAKGIDPKSSVTITNATMVAATLHYSPSEQLLRVIDPITRDALQMIYGEKMEHILEQNADLRSDIYSLAATLYHLLTNKPPTDSLKRTIEFWRENPDNLIPPHQINPAIPPEISEWLIKAMEIDRDKRYSSAHEMRKALHRVAAGESIREEEVYRRAREAEQEKLRIEHIERERAAFEKERLEHQRQIELDRQRLAALENKSHQDAPTVANVSLKEDIPTDEPDSYVTQTSSNPFVFEMPPQQDSPKTELPPPENMTGETEIVTNYKEPEEITQFKQPEETTHVPFPDNSPNSVEIPAEDTAVRIAYPNPAEFKQPENMPAAPEIFGGYQTAAVAAPKKTDNNNIFWIIPLAVLAVIFMGGIALGMWFFVGGSSDEKTVKDSPANSSTANNTADSTVTTEKNSPSLSEDEDKKDDDVKTPTEKPAPTAKTPVETKTTTTQPKPPPPTVQRPAPPVQTTKKDKPPPVKTDKPSKNRDCVFLPGGCR